MRKIISSALICWAVFIICGAPGIDASTPDVVIDYYTDGEKNIVLSPFSSQAAYSFPLRGSTRMKTLMIKMEKSGGSSRQLIIPLDADGSFNYIFLLKEGAGKYNFTLFGSPAARSLSFSGIGTFSVSAAENIPDDKKRIYLNDKIIEFVNASMGKKIGRGECWDLVQEALDLNGADWRRPLAFGQQINPDTEELKPGDIIQFKSVRLTENLPDGSVRRESIGMPDHTSVLYRIIGKRHYEVAEQNSNNQRFVVRSQVNLNNMTSGSFSIYRPSVILLKGDRPVK